ncbi:MAG TPA: Crp/Fnr family transcriptional regulator [Solirubrobacteraceae bacterium]|nr:Crp/Fnr family transcriptional regulator [Solirubrobacteraceae bacterium]
MSEGVHPLVDVCRVLEEDAELRDAIPASQRAQAVGECIARARTLRPGRWQTTGAPDGDAFGLLVVRGLIVRRVDVEGRFGSELLGDGDLLRPWQEDEPGETLSVTPAWRVIEPTRIALLDGQFARRASRYPQIGARLIGRALRRSRNLAVNMAIVHRTRVDVRLHMVLWHLAGRWGRVRPDGVSVPLHLTHSVLADLVAARRPTVTSALAELARQDLVYAGEDGWLLTGPPPGALLALEALPPALGQPRIAPGAQRRTLSGR